MRSQEGHPVIGTRRVGHAGLVCVITMVGLLVPHAGRAPADSRGKSFSVPDSVASTAAHPVISPSAGAQFVNYNGVRVTVPDTWPVIDLRRHPEACVRFDKPVVYLGSPGSQSECPAHAVGRVGTIWLRTVSAGQATPLTARPA